MMAGVWLLLLYVVHKHSAQRGREERGNDVENVFGGISKRQLHATPEKLSSNPLAAVFDATT